MSKSTRSISLPARAGALNDRTREVKTALKNSENLRRTEKENEIEEMYGRSSLSFRVDQVTLIQRSQFSQRQKIIADENMFAEIDCFCKLLQLTDSWQDSEIRDILSRMLLLTGNMKQKIGTLSQNSGNLGSLRQEYSCSNRIAIISQYVEMIKEKTVQLHQKVLETRKTLTDNNIDLDRNYLENKASRSVSINGMSQISSNSGNATIFNERSKSVTERVSDITGPSERRKSKKCSIFETISENITSKEIEEHQVSTPMYSRYKKKSSKKVSIAENLNCDYSDISSLYNEEGPLENNEQDEDNKQLENNSSDCDRLNLLVIKSMVKEVICNLLIFLLLAVLKILNIVSTKPFQCFGILLVLYLFSCIFNYKQDPY